MPSFLWKMKTSQNITYCCSLKLVDAPFLQHSKCISVTIMIPLHQKCTMPVINHSSITVQLGNFHNTKKDSKVMGRGRDNTYKHNLLGMLSVKYLTLVSDKRDKPLWHNFVDNEILSEFN